MREAMREVALKEEQKVRLSERNSKADRLIESYAKRPVIGEGIKDLAGKDANLARGLALVLENQEKHLTNLTETQISSAFGTTPENVMRVVRLGYPNSVRGEIFLEWAMETARDSIYYLNPIYGSTKRGATANAITHQSPAYNYSSEAEEEAVATQGASTTNWTGSLAVVPLKPYTVAFMVDGNFVANDNGAGVLSGSDFAGNAVTGTVDYTSGAYSITFGTAPALGAVVTVTYRYDSEVTSNYDELGEVQLQLRDYQFRVRPNPLGVSWSKMTELLIGTTLNIDAEEALIRGAGDEVKKALDFQACILGYRGAKSNNYVTFNADWAAAGADSEVSHAQSITKYFDKAADIMYNAIQRGGVSKIYGGPAATTFLKLHKRFDGSTKQPAVGAYRIGSIDGIDVYKVPSSIVPNNELVTVYKNEQVPEDVSVAFGTLIPLYKTQTLEYKNQYKETGLAHFGDAKILQNKYLVRIVMTNLS